MDRGGGAAGWCYRQVAIVPTGVPFDPRRANDPRSYVFAASCESTVSLEWAAEDRLRVTYSIGDGVTVMQWTQTPDHSVTLEYVISK